MKREELQYLLTHVDHTLLRPTASWEDLCRVAQEAMDWKMASLCIPPRYVRPLADRWGEQLRLCTVVGFPLGYNCTEMKVQEAKQAIADGAEEVDMVIALGDVLDAHYPQIVEEMQRVKAAVGEKILKVIIECCYLTREQKVRLCELVTEAGADFIKTSTGFGSGGATLEDVRLMAEHVGPQVKIKAAGGIRSLEEMAAFLAAGASRIGSSSAAALAAQSLPERR